MDQCIKVLVIEDNSDYAYLLGEMLAEIGDARFQVEYADRLSAGIERLTGGGINIVILDLSLPDSRGLDTYIKLSAHTAEVPVVVMTVFNEIIAKKAVEIGARGYFLKDQVDAGSLRHTIRHAIQ